MDKQKIDMSNASELCRWEEVKAGERVIHVRKTIPVKEKQSMAIDLVEFITSEDTESHVMLRNYQEELGEIYLTIKYYTDIDTDGISVNDVLDWAFNTYDECDTPVSDTIYNITYNDTSIVRRMADMMFDNIRCAYDAKNSLTAAIRSSFGFLFDGKDITETLAETQAVSDQMLDVVDKMNKAAKKPDGGKIKAGGNVISIAKKK